MKEVAFALMFLLLFRACPFCDVQWLAGFLFFFVKLLYYTSYFVQKLHPFFFCVLPNLWFEKLKLCPILLMLDWFHD